MKTEINGKFKGSVRVCKAAGIYMELESYETEDSKYLNVVHTIGADNVSKTSTYVSEGCAVDFLIKDKGLKKNIECLLLGEGV